MVAEYKNINIGENGEYFYLKYYMPKNKKTLLSEDISKHSDYILRYKKGDPRIIAFFVKILNNIIYNYFYFYDLILPVPPSNSYLDIYPNSIVCSYISALGKIRTFDKAIVCYKGHKPGHIEDILSKKNDLTHISIANKYDFENKNIIVFDDIATTGATFFHIKNALLKKGANSVIGLFLGKTYSPFKKEQEGING